MDEALDIIRTKSQNDYAWTVILRYQVFSIEQGFDPKFDIDEREDESIYYLALYDGKPVGTARYRMVNGQAKIEAMVVLKEYRKKGIATKLLSTIHRDLHENGITDIYLNAMTQADPFYIKLGYVREGKMFKTPAGAPHYKMVLCFPDNH